MSSSIDLSGAYADSGVKEVLEKLDRDLIGLQPVKTRIKEIAALLLIERARHGVGLSGSRPGLHMSFTGRPGTGKTTVARMISEILHKLGYLQRGHLITVGRDDLVGQFVGHTAPKTREIIQRAKGGVLFIDEAYFLSRSSDNRDYGAEAVEILLQDMELKREEFVVIFAGYKDRMDSFYRTNPGLSSRVAHHIDFPDYTNKELMKIAFLMLKRQNYVFSGEASIAFEEYIKRRHKLPFFANARSIQNAIDRIRLRHANRLFSRMPETLSREDLLTIEDEDILSSRVFLGEVDSSDSFQSKER